MTSYRFPLALIAAGTLLAGGVTACTTNEGAEQASGSSETSSAAEATTAEASEATEAEGEEAPGEGADAANANRPEECGLQELDGPLADVGPFILDVKYFQPGEMAHHPDSTHWMLSYAESQMHLEVDTKVTPYGTNWGYTVDETPANLHMVYALTDSKGKVLSQDMLMEMNAIDGSHYGTNLPKDTIKEPGTYTLKVTIYPPIDYDLHVDYITGVPEDNWFKPLTTEMEWEISQEDLDTIAAATVDNPLEPSEKCKDYPKKKYEDKAAEEAMKKAEGGTPIPKKH